MMLLASNSGFMELKYITSRIIMCCRMIFTQTRHTCILNAMRENEQVIFVFFVQVFKHLKAVFVKLKSIILATHVPTCNF